ncbi:hypothetical protein J437_LFUL018979 [Ladona fulva]|uniref:Uncharacterized protein n=1 Tax=Ladona fulva TaxID=123851 RepID=A0A8K0PCL4_LADFU|nr:hypothetical protein J437_LFUL018979 [Ladona fulva]
MELEGDSLMAMLLIRRKKRRNRRRRFWVNPLVLERRNRGLFHTLFDDLLQDDEKFFWYFRMSKSTFEELLCGIEISITKQNTIMRQSIPPAEKLALTLSNSNIENHRNIRQAIRPNSEMDDIGDDHAGRRGKYPRKEKRLA